jgi:hypothetical protein
MLNYLLEGKLHLYTDQLNTHEEDWLISYATMVSRPDRLDIGHYFDARDQI